MTATEILNTLKNKKKALEFQMKLQTGLISHNYIVVVGASTVSTNEKGQAILSRDTIPSQWTASGVKEIKDKCSWTNMNGSKMKVEAVPYKEWYSNQLQSVTETLSFIQKAQ